jgi:ABC-type glycerol-3-phosphate transport system permease component
MSGWRAQRRRGRRLRALGLGLALLAWTLPLVWTLLASLGVMPDDTRSPPSWRVAPGLASYAGIAAVDPDLRAEGATSTGLAGGVTLLALAIGLPAAYGLARAPGRGRAWAVPGCLVLAGLPIVAYVLPLDDGLRRLGLHGTLLGTLAAETAAVAALAVYALCGYVGQVPVELEEAARLDGASTPRVLRSVVLPGTAAGLAATGVVLFVLAWNQLLVPLVVGAPAVKTLPVAMVDFFTLERGVEWPPAAAALVLALLPPALVVAVAHRALAASACRRRRRASNRTWSPVSRGGRIGRSTQVSQRWPSVRPCSLSTSSHAVAKRPPGRWLWSWRVLLYCPAG